eukprot:6484093-Amphidinium_carterae.1
MQNHETINATRKELNACLRCLLLCSILLILSMVLGDLTPREDRGRLYAVVTCTYSCEAEKDACARFQVQEASKSWFCSEC